MITYSELEFYIRMLEKMIKKQNQIKKFGRNVAIIPNSRPKFQATFKYIRYLRDEI